jgi:phage gpG-like protein
VLRFTARIDGVSQSLAAFLKLQKDLVDLRKLGAWDLVQAKFYRILKNQFETEGGAGKSGKWQALSSKYKPVKQKRWGDVGILQASGKLYKSLTSESSDSIVEKRPQELIIGTSLPYARAQHAGYSPRNLPARPIISLTEEQEKDITEPLTRKVKQLIQNVKLTQKRGF